MPQHTSAVSRSVAAVIALCGLFPAATVAQSPTSFTVCTQGALANCAAIDLSTEFGVGPDGSNLFRIVLANLGSTTTPSLPTTIYNLIFATGLDPAVPGTEVDNSVTPVALGGATLSDPSAWDIFDSGDAIFVSALSGNGVGGCVAGPAIGGFSQGGQTCGSGPALSFSFYTPRVFDPSAFTVLDYEVAGLTDDLPADACGGTDSPCKVTVNNITTTPEPSAVLLLATALVGLSFVGLRRRHVQTVEFRS